MKLSTLRCAVIGAAIALLGAPYAGASVTSTGNVSPAPPAGGGVVAGPLFVGDTGIGTMTVSGTPATSVSVTGGSIFVGNGAAAVGIVTLSGLGSNMSTNSTFDLVIGAAGTGSVALNQLAQIQLADDLLMGTTVDSLGSLFVADIGTTVDVTDVVTVGNSGEALIQITNGARVFANLSTLGTAATGDGRITVSGHASTWQQDGTMTIGDAGKGEVQVLSAGRADAGALTIGNAATGSGLAVVSGTSSSWAVAGTLLLGNGGLGTLNVLEAGQMTTTGLMRMAALAGSESHAVISGTNSQLAVATTVTVGDAGFATFDVRSSGRVTSGNVIIADNAGSRGEVQVDGAGSQWKITGTLDVSEPGEAQLAITGGGLVTTTGVARIGTAGRLLMSTGRLDAGSTGLTNNGLIQGTGRITGNVINAATGKIRLAPGNSMVLGNALANSGLVDLDASELEILGTLTNNADIDARNSTLRAGGSGVVNTTGSQLAITEGTVDVYGAVANNAGAQIVVGDGATVVFHDTLANNGQFFLFPGANVVALEDLAFTPNSMLALQLGPESETSQSAIEAAGDADLAGFLAVTLAPGYAPAAGDTFQVLSAAGGVSGTFAAPTLPGLASGLQWDLDYTPSAVILAVVPGLSADFNSDGHVNDADLGLWRAGFGKATGALKTDGDADGDGDSDGNDYLIWQRELGRSVNVASNVASVPEPASGTLGVALFGLLASRFRRKRRNS